MIVVDTNVLVYAVSQQDPHHGPSRELIEKVAGGQLLASVFPQNLLEFYAVMTNPRRVRNPLSVADALKEISALRSIMQVIVPREQVLDVLPRLVLTAGTTQADVFDAFVAAQIQDAGVSVLCTYNKSDFAGFSIVLKTPDELLDDLCHHPDGTSLVQDRPRRRSR